MKDKCGREERGKNVKVHHLCVVRARVHPVHVHAFVRMCTWFRVFVHVIARVRVRVRAVMEAPVASAREGPILCVPVRSGSSNIPTIWRHH